MESITMTETSVSTTNTNWKGSSYMAKYKSVEEITTAFLKKGWSNITFSEVTIDEARERGLLFALPMISKGKKVFKMNETGNIYSDTGRVLIYNI